MPTSFYRSTAAAAMVGVGLTFLGAPAGAQACYPPTPGCVTTTSSVATAVPTLTLSATTVARGQTVGAIITGFRPLCSGILTIASVEQQIGSFTMPASGAATSSITIPTSISLGAHTVFARCTGVDGSAASASQAVTVVAAGTTVDGDGSSNGASGSRLARTGFYLIPVSVIGLGLVAGGVVLKRSSTRRKTSTTV